MGLPRRLDSKYPAQSLIDAYDAVKKGILTVTEASRHYGIPCQTIRGRVINKGSFGSGAVPVFTHEEEKNFVDFLTNLYNLGYGFLRTDMLAVASEYAVYLGKRTSDNPFRIQWMFNVIKRWPELAAIGKKCTLSLSYVLTRFFDNLNRVMVENSFDTKPHLVFSVTDIEIRQDDTGQDEDHVLATVLACGSADGQLVPPFFVFPGRQMTVDLMKGALPGSSGVASDDGLVNAEVFIQFLNEHLLNSLAEEEQGKPVLVHVNGVKFSSVGLMELAKSQNIFLIFPPYEISNALMPVDVGCIEPFQALYTKECEKYIEETSSDVAISNVCEVVCKVYEKALTKSNITEGFRKAGLFPCNRHMLILNPASLGGSVECTSDW